MFSRKVLRNGRIGNRMYACGTTCGTPKFTVAVIGACGGIGQPLSLLLKLNPAIGELRLHDMKDTPGVAADLSHIETSVKVTHTTGPCPDPALKGGVDIIVVPAGMPRKPGMKRSDLFEKNASVAFDSAKSMAEHSPDSILVLVTNPVNSLIPICCDVLKAAGKLNPGRIFGCSTLDSVRSSTFVGEIICHDPKDITVPVVGGHSGISIIPVFSRSSPPVCLDDKKLDELTKKVQEAGTTVVKAKAGKGSATLAMAYAGSRFTFSVIRALNGEPNVVECSYVKSDVYPELKYLASPILLGKCGIEKNLGLGTLSDFEKNLFCKMIPTLKKDIEKGEDYVKKALMCTSSKKC